MEKRNKMEYIFALMFAVALGSTLVLLITFYDGIRNASLGYGYVALVNMNNIGEFWFEFIGLHIGIVLLIMGFLWGLNYIFLKGEW